MDESIMRSKRSEDAEFRCVQDTLVTSGTSVIVFCLWDVAKLLLLFVFGKIQLFADTFAMLAYMSNPLEMVLFIALPIIIELSICIFVGYAARSEGKGRPRSAAYVVLAVLLMLASAGALVWEVLTFGTIGLGLFDSIAMIMLELTSLVMLGELVAAAIRIRRFRAYRQGGDLHAE